MGISLYEISNELLEVLNAMSEENSEDYADTLQAVQMEWEEKADNVACYIKQLAADAAALKAEEETLNKRRKQKEKDVEKLTAYLFNQMQITGNKKIETSRNVIQVKKLPPSVKIADERGFIQLMESIGGYEYISYKEPTVNKTAIKNAIKSGIEFDMVTLECGEKLSIK